MKQEKKSFDSIWMEIMQDAKKLDSYKFTEKRSKELEEWKNLNTHDTFWILRKIILRFYDTKEENESLKEKILLS